MWVFVSFVKVIKDKTGLKVKTPQEIQRALKEERREKLKQLSMKEKANADTTKKLKVAPPPCFKVTEKNRGNFLIEGLVQNNEPKAQLSRIPKLAVARPEPDYKVKNWHH